MLIQNLHSQLNWGVQRLYWRTAQLVQAVCRHPIDQRRWYCAMGGLLNPACLCDAAASCAPPSGLLVRSGLELVLDVPSGSPFSRFSPRMSLYLVLYDVLCLFYHVVSIPAIGHGDLWISHSGIPLSSYRRESQDAKMDSWAFCIHLYNKENYKWIINQSSSPVMNR